MTNDFANIPSESEFRNEMTVESQEVAPDSHLEMEYEDRVSGSSHEQEPDQGWPGDGSGEDDLADFNANEASDYCDE